MSTVELYDKIKNEIAEKFIVVQNLHEDTPFGEISDADTILGDILDEHGINGNWETLQDSVYEVRHIYGNSSDKMSTDAMFAFFTGCSILEYLNRCEEQITRNPYTKSKLKPLLADDERVCQFHIAGEYVTREFIAPNNDIYQMDIAAALEETLHRLLDNNMTDDVLEILGAIIPNDNDEQGDNDCTEFVSLDLGYIIPGQIDSISEYL